MFSNIANLDMKLNTRFKVKFGKKTIMKGHTVCNTKIKIK